MGPISAAPALDRLAHGGTRGLDAAGARRRFRFGSGPRPCCAGSTRTRTHTFGGALLRTRLGLLGRGRLAVAAGEQSVDGLRQGVNTLDQSLEIRSGMEAEPR